MPTLDEVALRRPDFREGVLVVMGDGQAWQLAKPIIRFVPADNDTGYEVRCRLNDDGAFGLAFTAYEAAEAGADVIRTGLALGRAMLLANYSLTPDQLADVLQFGMGDDEEGRRIMDETIAVALGNGPKPSDGGGE